MLVHDVGYPMEICLTKDVDHGGAEPVNQRSAVIFLQRELGGFIRCRFPLDEIEICASLCRGGQADGQIGGEISKHFLLQFEWQNGKKLTEKTS